MKRRSPDRIILLLICALASCASSPTERFYTLRASQLPESVRAAACSISVGPVTIPAIVNRPQMVLRTGPNRVMLAEQSRWAEPLDDNIARVIADNLGHLLHDIPVTAYPQSMTRDADYRVLVDVQRFDSTLDEAAVIDVLWSIRDAGNRKRKEGRSLVRESVAGEGNDALVAAHDRALAAVSRDIAAALRVVASSH